jgi:hypothetical protein
MKPEFPESRSPISSDSFPMRGAAPGDPSRSQWHLQAYLNEFTFRFNRRFWPFSAFNSLLGIASHTEGPTYKGLYKGTYQHPNEARR